MKVVFKILGLFLVVLILVGAGGYLWASSTSARILSQGYETHRVDFPVPFPLDDDEVDEMAAARAEAGEPGLSAEELRGIALERAIDRGRHLVEARYGCTECHGANFGGGVMVDAFPIGSLLGPNLTEGAGSVTINYAASDWDRIVRHGIRPDGRPTPMPAEDFRLMSDQELSDIVAFIRSRPPVDNSVPPSTLGPLGKVLVATGQIVLAADLIESHTSPHTVYPPEAAVSVEFGGHLAATCTGCHGQNLAGGPIAGGDPSWVPARNLTPAPSALGSWELDDFVTAMRDGVRPDGTALQVPMTFILPYAQNMADLELEAIWLYLRSLPPVAPES